MIINTNQSNFYFHSFCPSFLFFSFFLQLNLLAAATTSKVVVDLIRPSDQMPPGREKSILAGADGAPDCRRSQRNRTVWFP
jgi:hypothetical protein